MVNSTFRYKNVFLHSSLQFCGHIEEYFASHTQKLVVYVINPRLRSVNNLLRVYEEGKLIKQKSIWSSENLLLYYLSWYFHYLYFLFTNFDSRQKVIILAGHPINFLGMNIVKALKKTVFAYWVGDYFPPVNWSLVLFEKLKKHYHDRVQIKFYLSDRINKIFNGKVIRKSVQQTVMWGVSGKAVERKFTNGFFTILFVGLLKGGQGLEEVFTFLSANPSFKLKIIGICPANLYRKYMKIILDLKIDRQVFFPNKFYSEKHLARIAKTCQVGVALYDPSPRSATFYTDPGKVKAYAELGLPIVMTDTSAIASYIRKFHCGEIVRENNQLPGIFSKIRSHYGFYQQGLKNFLAYFDYEQYYRKSFEVLEEKYAQDF